MPLIVSTRIEKPTPEDALERGYVVVFILIRLPEPSRSGSHVLKRKILPHIA